ncbi:MAG: ectonucleotide pyrophosphatase/phosphodiesterase, partial [Lachnospiraceae bacterium]|nr:ectonucleotide pyrophosphatase/phosphodiesterase [Lachnospiraceae bacterium]
MLIISFDAIGDDEFDELKKYPAVASFIRKASVHRDVSSIFVSNTYPVHTSVATGVTPDKHGISSNTEPFPSRNQKWVTCEKSIRSKTIWQAAKDKGMKTAAVLWPVTSYSKSLDYNIPEEHISPGRSQVVANLRAGSAMLQLKMFLKYHKLIAGTDEPHLSNFSAACMADILRNNKPDLALVHLITYDSFCHKYGRGESKLKEAYEALDRNLALLLDAAGDNRDIIIFSDHSQINVHTAITPNQILVETGLLSYDKDEYNIGESGCFIECCGG